MNVNNRWFQLVASVIAMIMIGTSLAVGAIGSGITLRRFLQV